MYGESSGLLDVLEHPSLRLMKPLPKRRRTVSPPNTVDELPAQLQHPAHDLLQHSLDPGPVQTIVDYTLDTADSTAAADAVGGSTPGDDALDYGDHHHMRGNKKKRKVPAALAGHVSGSRSDVPEGREDVVESDLLGLAAPGAAGANGELATAMFSPAQLRLSPAARAGLRRKLMVHERKQLLAAVLEQEENLDPMAVEHALGASSPFMLLEEQSRVRSSRRIASRMARIAKSQPHSTLNGSASSTKTAPSGAFEYQCTSALSERLAAERRQVSRLRGRFQEELERQAASAAKAAKQPVIAPKQTPSHTQPRSRPMPALTVDSSLTDPPSTVSGGKKKKKKRSALANASNPHHLRNYVPSRLPNSGPPNPAQASLEAQNLISPLPLRFLNANLPRSRQSDDASLDVTSANTGTVPTETSDEWICPFCEYNLFYGDERAFQSALRSRKKVLRRRRRARERAAAAASGKSLTPKAIASRTQDEEEDALFDPPHEDVPESITSQVKWNSRVTRETDQRGSGGSG